MQYANGRDVRSARASLRTGRRTRGRERAPWPRAGRPRRIRVAGGANRRGDAREPPRARHRRTLHYGEAALCALSWTPFGARAGAEPKSCFRCSDFSRFDAKTAVCEVFASAYAIRTKGDTAENDGADPTDRVLPPARGARARPPSQRWAPFFPRSSASRDAFPSAPSSAFSAFFPRSSTRFGFAAARSAPAS
jgi:hypothetical protein